MIRHAELQDLPAITEIYNQAIEAGFQTAFTEKFKPEERIAWFEEHTKDSYPLFVSIEDGLVAGWLSISPYRKGRAALRQTVEISYFLDKSFRGRGIGTQLINHGLEVCKELGYKTVIAIIIDRNVASINLVEKLGFARWGYLPAVATFKGEECGHLYYGCHVRN